MATGEGDTAAGDTSMDGSLIFRPGPIEGGGTKKPVGAELRGAVRVHELADGQYQASWTDGNTKIEQQGAPFDIQVFVQMHAAMEYHPVLMKDGRRVEIRDWVALVRAEEGRRRPQRPAEGTGFVVGECQLIAAPEDNR
ncbi:hypothetical protein GTR02_21090 [Kineococcus sp. R8]|uniref:hypothetical protein n=1 Tax=Kineococcus siccus TaxID=2696567 RepID=UPI00141318E8|nr:hypothetical protein [Kineococcus siccus]NAZ84302.1 hypothetical protein [Kineococcus siccus]